jgi:hypothetical protein
MDFVPDVSEAGRGIAPGNPLVNPARTRRMNSPGPPGDSPERAVDEVFSRANRAGDRTGDGGRPGPPLLFFGGVMLVSRRDPFEGLEEMAGFDVGNALIGAMLEEFPGRWSRRSGIPSRRAGSCGCRKCPRTATGEGNGGGVRKRRRKTALKIHFQ